MARKIMACRTCGGTNVRRDAWAEWSEENQCWELGAVFDHEHCEDCEGETRIERYEEAAEPIIFEGLGRCFYIKGPKRPPRKGEFYLSGNPVQGWLMPNDALPIMVYQIAKPTHRVVNIEARGDEIEEEDES